MMSNGEECREAGSDFDSSWISQFAVSLMFDYLTNLSVFVCLLGHGVGSKAVLAVEGALVTSQLHKRTILGPHDLLAVRVTLHGRLLTEMDGVSAA